MTISPEQLFSQLQDTATIKGQDDFLKSLCTATWLHHSRYDYFNRTGKAINKPSLNLLCLGESDVKIIIQALGKILDLPVLIEDASQLRGEGWNGGKPVSSMVSRIFESANGDGIKAKYCIVFLDNIDKVFQYNVINRDSKFNPVKDLMNFIDGSNITYIDSGKELSLNTENLLFICSGTFEEGFDDNLSNTIKRRLSKTSKSEELPEIPKKNIFEFATKEDLYRCDCTILWRSLIGVSLIPTTNDISIGDHSLTDTKNNLIQELKDVLYP